MTLAACLSFILSLTFTLLDILEIAASVMDALVQTMMKGAVKCIRHCELQNSVNQWGIERILCFWDIPASMLESVP